SAPSMFSVAPVQASDVVGGVNDGDAVHSIVALAPASPIAGPRVSTTVTVWLTVELWFPQALDASHLRVMVLAQVEPPVTSAPRRFTDVDPVQSEAVGGVNEGVAVH